MTPTLTEIADVVRANVHPDHLRDLKVHPCGMITYTMDEMYRYFCSVVIRDGKILDMSRLSPDGDALEQTFDDLDAYARFFISEEV